MQAPVICAPPPAITPSTNITIYNHLQSLCGRPLIPVTNPSPIDFYTMGVAYLLAGQSDRAIPLFQKLGVSSQGILYLRFQPEFRQDTDKLASLVYVAIHLNPYKEGGKNPYRDLLISINDYQEWGMPSQAADLHDLIVRYETEDTLRYWLSATEALYLRGDIDGADRLYIKAKQMWPYERILHQRHGGLLLQNNRWAEAIVAGKEWLTYFPEDSHAMYQIGQSYYRSGQYDEAVRWLTKALQNLSTEEVSIRDAIEDTLVKIAEKSND